MNKFFKYHVIVVLFLSFIAVMGFSSIVKYHYQGGKKIQLLQKPVMFIAGIPYRIKQIIENRSFNLNKIQPLIKHKYKNRFKQFIKNDRNALLILPRYDLSLSRSIVEIIDLNNFEVIHTYKHDIAEMNDQVTNSAKFPRLKIDNSPTRFQYQHSLLLDDGSLISTNAYYPIFKIDICSNLKWINDEEMFHHGTNLEHDGNIWAMASIDPKSRYVNQYQFEAYLDDAIIKLDIDGNILFRKSVTEILIENNVVPESFVFNNYLSNQIDPIHLNDIEPTFQDTKYWNKGDLFISLREQNVIIHFRPRDNKVINVITGPFAMQHDVDVISDKEISIFNNNNFIKDNKHSEVLVYNFETKTFIKLFNDQLKKNNFKTESNGLSEILRDGSLMVEETIHGRIILFNNQGKKEWEFINKDKNGDIGRVNWIRVIEDEIFIEKFKSLIKNNKCLN